MSVYSPLMPSIYHMIFITSTLFLPHIGLHNRSGEWIETWVLFLEEVYKWHKTEEAGEIDERTALKYNYIRNFTIIFYSDAVSV